MGEAVTTTPIRDVESLKLLTGVCSRDPHARIHVLDSVMSMFENWLDGYASPTISSFTTHANGVSDKNDIDIGVNGFTVDLKHMIREQLPDILRLAITCPFQNVREKCAFILQDLQVSKNVDFMFCYLYVDINN